MDIDEKQFYSNGISHKDRRLLNEHFDFINNSKILRLFYGDNIKTNLFNTFCHGVSIGIIASAIIIKYI